MNTLVPHASQALRYYRDQVFLSVDELAKKTAVSANKIQEAEQSDTPIFKLSQLEKIAKALFVPAIDLCLDELNTKNLPAIVDFRNNPDLSLHSYSYQSIIHEAYEQRENYLLVLQTLDEEPKSFNLELTGVDAVADANDIRAYFNIESNQEKLTLSSGDEYYNAWRKLIESKDVLVFEKPRVNIKSDGLALYYPVCPTIVLFSSGQHYSRRLFTLIHELVHLGLKQSRLDGSVYSLDEHDEERYCNAVAGYVLAPELELQKYWDSSLPLNESIKRIRKQLKISKPAIVMQLYMTKRISQTELNRVLNEFEQEYAPKSTGQPRSPSKDSSTLKQYGKVFVQNVISAFWQDSISLATAQQILNLNPQKYPLAFKELETRVFSNA